MPPRGIYLKDDSRFTIASLKIPYGNVKLSK